MVGEFIRVGGTDKASKNLSDAVKHLDQPHDLYSDIATALVASTVKRFETETDPQGSSWPPSVRALAQGGKTLRDTGNLYRSIQAEIYQDGLAVGSNAIQAGIHQHGGVIKAKTKRGLSFRPLGANSNIIVKSVTMPRRAFLGLDDQDERDIIAISESYLAAPLNQRGV